MTLTVASYNIHRCIGTDGRYDPNRVIAVLKEIDADVVALQEVENRSGEGHALLQLDHLADALGMRSIPDTRLVKRWGDYGNALLTRLPIVEIQRHNLSFNWCEPRGALDVTLEAGDSPLRIVATHLGLGRFERRYQSMRLVKLLEAGVPGIPCLVLGDMNEWLPWSRHLRWLDRILGARDGPATFPSRFPVLRLDRLWLRPGAALQDLRVHGGQLARVASDHLPLRAEICLDILHDRRSAEHRPPIPLPAIASRQAAL